MANLLALDFDGDQLRVVAIASKRGGVTAERCIVWPLPEALTTNSAERLGRAFRDGLKAVGVGASQAVATLPRDKVAVRDLTFPSVATGDEPALVRFQIGKEASEPLDSLVIDYQVQADLGANKRAMAVSAKRDLVVAIGQFCKGAGLRLAGLTPRFFGLIAAVERKRGAGIVQPEAVLAPVGRISELVVVENGLPTLARSLVSGGSMFGEARRTLAVTKAQRADSPTWESFDGVTLLESGNESEAPAGLVVRELDPFLPSDASPDSKAAKAWFAAGLGTAHLLATRGSLPVNLVAPRKAQSKERSTVARAIFYAASAAVILIMAIGGAWYVLGKQKSELARLKREGADLEGDLKMLAQDKVDIEGLKEWDQTTVSWLDELHDLTARLPDQVGFRLQSLTAVTQPRKAGKDGKDIYAGRITLTGVAPANKSDTTLQFNKALTQDRHLKASLENTKKNNDRSDIFTLKIDVARQPRSQYTARIVLPKRGADEGTEVDPATEGAESDGGER